MLNPWTGKHGRAGAGHIWVVALLLAAFPVGLALGTALWPKTAEEQPQALAVGAGASIPVATASGPTIAGHRPEQTPGTNENTDGPLRRVATDSSQQASGTPAAQQVLQAQPAFEGAQSARSGASNRFTPIVEAARRVAPSVVSVTVLRTVSGRARLDPFGFFSRRRSRRTARALGSGFLIDTAGYILTNDHVVRDADSIVIADSEGRVFKADVVGSDALTDLALLKIPANQVPSAPLGTSSDLMVGEPAIAIGNPLGYLLANSEATVTAGVISGVGRDILGDRNEALMADLVQTDASINPGNSGGPLVNADGRVIGVNSSIFSRSGGSEGLGFAIPIDRALRVAQELRQFGEVRRPWVGLWAAEITVDNLIPQTAVRRVAAGSPADRAGLQDGDLLVSVNGRSIQSALGWELGLLDAGVPSTVEVEYERDGKRRTVRLEVEELPSGQAERVEVVRGLQLITLTPAIALERRIDVEAGALIAQIEPRASATTGLREGDVILSINRQPVLDAQSGADIFQSYAGRGRIVVVFHRGGRNYQSIFSVS